MFFLLFVDGVHFESIRIDNKNLHLTFSIFEILEIMC